MTAFRSLALAAAALAVQFSLLASAQASSIQAAEITALASAPHVGFYLVEPHKLAPPAPLFVSAESALQYGRMTAGAYSKAPGATGALAAYYAAKARLGEQPKSQAFAPAGATPGAWTQGATRWQFEEISRDWRFHTGHWRDSEDEHHGHEDDGHEHEHPPAVPIPAALWLFGSGLALLALVQRAQRGRHSRHPAVDAGLAAAR